MNFRMMDISFALLSGRGSGPSCGTTILGLTKYGNPMEKKKRHLFSQLWYSSLCDSQGGRWTLSSRNSCVRLKDEYVRLLEVYVSRIRSNITTSSPFSPSWELLIKTKQINKRKLFGEKEIAYILIVVVLHDYLCFSKLNNCISKKSELYCANYISINLI